MVPSSSFGMYHMVIGPWPIKWPWPHGPLASAWTIFMVIFFIRNHCALTHCHNMYSNGACGAECDDHWKLTFFLFTKARGLTLSGWGRGERSSPAEWKFKGELPSTFDLSEAHIHSYNVFARSARSGVWWPLIMITFYFILQLQLGTSAFAWAPWEHNMTRIVPNNLQQFYQL